MSPRFSAQLSRAGCRALEVAPLAAFLVLACPTDTFTQQNSVRLRVDLPAGPSAAARLFVQKGCAGCHAIGGGGPQIGPALGGIESLGNVLELASAFWNHAPAMRTRMQEHGIQQPQITPLEMADLIGLLTAYRYYDLRIRASGNPLLGREVFVGKGCATCHEGAASWTTLGPDLQKYRGRYAPIFLVQSMWNHSSRMTSQMQARGMPWPRLTGQEMANLTAYLQVGATPGPEPPYFEPGNPRRGQALFRAKRCSACHSVGEARGRGGPELGTRGMETAGSIADTAASMWNHRQQMGAEFARRGIPFVTFSGQEMADVIAYLYFVRYSNAIGAPDRGRGVFARNCAACHSGTATGIGPDLTRVPGLDTPIAIIAAMWNHASSMEDRARERGLSWPRLEAGETADLMTFLIVSRKKPASR